MAMTPGSFSRNISPVNVVIIGPTGAGKSTLGNILLYGTDEIEGGFVVGHGPHSETMKCHAKAVRIGDEHSLQVIDTPGVPDTDPKKTLRGYDNIIEHVRRSPSLNAVIFHVAAGRVKERDYRNYRILLRQFNALPCPKILVCRVDTDESCRSPVKERKEAAAKELIENVIKHAELENVACLILHKTNEKDVQGLRQIVCNMPSIDLARATLHTYEEIKSRYERLSKRKTRISELGAEVNLLREKKHEAERAMSRLNGSIRDLERKKTLMSAFAIVFFATLVLAPIGGFAFKKVLAYDILLESMATEIKAAKESVSTLMKEIQAKRAEISSGSINQIELQRAKKEFDELTSLAE